MKRRWIAAGTLLLLAACGTEADSEGSSAPSTSERSTTTTVETHDLEVIVLTDSAWPMCAGGAEAFTAGEAVTVEAAGETLVGRLGEPESAIDPKYGSEKCGWSTEVEAVPVDDSYNITVEGENGALFTVTHNELDEGGWRVRLPIDVTGSNAGPGAPAFGPDNP